MLRLRRLPPLPLPPCILLTHAFASPNTHAPVLNSLLFCHRQIHLLRFICLYASSLLVNLNRRRLYNSFSRHRLNGNYSVLFGERQKYCTKHIFHIKKKQVFTRIDRNWRTILILNSLCLFFSNEGKYERRVFHMRKV